MMPDRETGTGDQGPVSQEDRIRANAYALLGHLLACAPDRRTLALLRAVDEPAGDSDAPMARAWAELRTAAEQAREEVLAEEFFELFIGIGKGELVPYGSWYLTGFLMEQPLAALRDDLDTLGFERRAGVREPEDHVAALCEVMSQIIDAGEDIPLTVQRVFAEKHMLPWMRRFFVDLQRAGSARFYRAVGQVGERFLEIERRYLSM